MPKFSDRALFFSCHGLFYASVLALALSSCTSLPSMSSNKLKLVTANFIDRTTACVNPLWTSRLTGNWQKKFTQTFFFKSKTPLFNRAFYLEFILVLLNFLINRYNFKN